MHKDQKRINRFKEDIDRQIESNHGKNLFYEGKNKTLSFIPETFEAIRRIGKIDKDSENLLTDYITNRVLQEFCRINQYYTFDKQAKKDLRNIYSELFSVITENKISHDLISGQHFGNLENWLHKTNSFADSYNFSENEMINPVACSEYSSGLQIEILHIDIDNLLQPVLDIGCGKEGNLVNHLRFNGIEAYGIDRFSENNAFFINSDWSEYDYGVNKWGTIVSNLGFSNHFKHHHSRAAGGNFLDYARKYMEILNSLKSGGSFHYAPDLPFIEMYLDKKKFRLTKSNVGEYDFKAVKIKRLI
jgi:hypothetical protein